MSGSVGNFISDGAKVGNVIQAGNLAGSIDMRDGSLTISPAPITEPPEAIDDHALTGTLQRLAESVTRGDIDQPASDAQDIREACADLIHAIDSKP